ncbi:glycoside hydrolase domain-containing protein [Olivibacter jilunii]|uniref:glycoside hydrolase domain-containing protein n=1 Tax=Olivibacter jilunii TaxID=985016 RepID=UPI003F18D507
MPITASANFHKFWLIFLLKVYQKEFAIKVYKNSDTNVYIQSIKLNGRPLKKNYISFADISMGGVLELYMGASGFKGR